MSKSVESRLNCSSANCRVSFDQTLLYIHFASFQVANYPDNVDQSILMQKDTPLKLVPQFVVEQLSRCTNYRNVPLKIPGGISYIEKNRLLIPQGIPHFKISLNMRNTPPPPFALIPPFGIAMVYLTNICFCIYHLRRI